MWTDLGISYFGNQCEQNCVGTDLKPCKYSRAQLADWFCLSVKRTATLCCCACTVQDCWHQQINLFVCEVLSSFLSWHRRCFAFDLIYKVWNAKILFFFFFFFLRGKIAGNFKASHITQQKAKRSMNEAHAWGSRWRSGSIWTFLSSSRAYLCHDVLLSLLRSSVWFF